MANCATDVETVVTCAIHTIRLIATVYHVKEIFKRILDKDEAF